MKNNLDSPNRVTESGPILQVSIDDFNLARKMRLVARSSGENANLYMLRTKALDKMQTDKPCASSNEDTAMPAQHSAMDRS
jgi:hypothetical protein